MARRFAVLSHLLPPAATGQPVMLARLLERLAPEDYFLVGLSAASRWPEADIVASTGLPARRHWLPPEGRLVGAGRLHVPHLDWRWRAVRRAHRLARVLGDEKAGAVIACSGDLLNIPAAVLAARRARVRLLAYYFDDYPFQWLESRQRRFAATWERRLLRGAARVIVPNEMLRDELVRRGASRVTIVRNPTPAEATGEASEAPWPATAGAVRILFTGAVYHAHLDAFRDLLRAIDLAGAPEFRLVIHTVQTAADLAALGVSGERVEYAGHVPQEQLQQALRAADIVFLPLAFDSPIPEVIRTSAPGKLGEYLACGRPLLVHAPADSFPAWYARTQRCGFVADERGAEALAATLRRIAADAAARRETTAAALACARRDFSPAAARAAFLGAVWGD